MNPKSASSTPSTLIETSQIDFDQPLVLGRALDTDSLERRPFAEAVVGVLEHIPEASGLTLSIEGAWGSGKTSALVMIEELLQSKNANEKPITVHFNPWIVGDRDALLSQFLNRIASTVKVSDNAKTAKHVAKTIKAYSKAFDVIKLIPGAEPWATIVKTAFSGVGDTAESIAAVKMPDLEQHKAKVEEALRNFPRSIVVFIDDIDRLYPTEVFEMIRIVKAIGGLPKIGYVIALDPLYIRDSLKAAKVANPDSYLDKVIQIRMLMPSLSRSARKKLFNGALSALPEIAFQIPFKDSQQRIGEIFFYSLCELLEQPRDFARVFNTVQIIEPVLRNEVVLGDIIGLAALMVKATPVYELLRRHPRYFVGRLSPDQDFLQKTEEIIKLGEPERNAAILACSAHESVRRLVHLLFPAIAKAEKSHAFSWDITEHKDGRLAHPARLIIALQLAVTTSDTSLGHARIFIQDPEKREVIARALTEENCAEFIELIGQIANAMTPEDIYDLPKLCVELAELVDKSPFVDFAKSRDRFLSIPPWLQVFNTIRAIIRTINPGCSRSIAKRIIETPAALTISAAILEKDTTSGADKSLGGAFDIDEDDAENLIGVFAANVLDASERNLIFETSEPGFVLRTLAHLKPQACADVFSVIAGSDANLDRFALASLSHSVDSVKGQTYSLSDDEKFVTQYCTTDELVTLARRRVDDPSLNYPARAAWRSIIEGKKLYGVDGTEASR